MKFIKEKSNIFLLLAMTLTFFKGNWNFPWQPDTQPYNIKNNNIHHNCTQHNNTKCVTQCHLTLRHLSFVTLI
jgi:hypothetical protein